MDDVVYRAIVIHRGVADVISYRCHRLHTELDFLFADVRIDMAISGQRE